MVTGGAATHTLGFPAVSTVRASIRTPVASAGMSPLPKVNDQLLLSVNVAGFSVPPPILTSTFVPLGAVPKMVTVPLFSFKFMILLPAIGVLIAGTPGSTVSTVIGRDAVGLTLPSVSVWKTERFGEPSAGTSSAAKSIDQRSSESAVTVFVGVLPQVTDIVDPLNAEPLIVTPAPFSAAFTTSLVATAATKGAKGAPVFTTTGAVAAVPVLPATSLCVTLIVAAPTALISALANVADQAPAASALTVLLDVVPHAIVTSAFASDVPATTTPAARSKLLITLSPAIGRVTTGATGAAVSIVTGCPLCTLTLPAKSVTTAVIVVSPSLGICPLVKDVAQTPDASVVTDFSVAPHFTKTVLPASAVPVTCTPRDFSLALTRLSGPVTLSNVAGDTDVSIEKLRCRARPTFPNWSVGVAVMTLLPDNGISAAPNNWLHVPSASATGFLITVPQTRRTVAPASAVPLTSTPFVRSFPLMTSLPAMLLITGVAVPISISTGRSVAALTFRALSRAVAETILAPSGGICDAAKVVRQTPSASAVDVRVAVPQETVTNAPVSAVPDTSTDAVDSPALMELSSDTILMTGASGITVSIRISRPTSPLTLPAWSVDCAVTVVTSVSAGISAVGKLTTQTPLWLAKAFRVIPPSVTTTFAPGSAWPVTVTFTAFSAALMTLSVATEAIVRSWLSVSMVTGRIPGSLTLPEVSVATTTMFAVPSAGICAPLNDALHVPFAATLMMRLIDPQVSSIDAFGSDVPRKVTPFSFSAALMMLSVATG